VLSASSRRSTAPSSSRSARWRRRSPWATRSSSSPTRVPRSAAGHYRAGLRAGGTPPPGVLHVLAGGGDAARQPTAGSRRSSGPAALPTQPREIATVNGATAQADRLHRQQESTAKPAPPGNRQGHTVTTGQVSHAAKNEHFGWPEGSTPSQRLAAAGPCQQPPLVTEPCPNGSTGPHTAAVAVLSCCTTRCPSPMSRTPEGSIHARSAGVSAVRGGCRTGRAGRSRSVATQQAGRHWAGYRHRPRRAGRPSWG
jgi:hypothetical protein